MEDIEPDNAMGQGFQCQECDTYPDTNLCTTTNSDYKMCWGNGSTELVAVVNQSLTI